MTTPTDLPNPIPAPDHQHRPDAPAVAVSGATGLVGGALVNVLGPLGWRTLRLRRGEATQVDEVRWNPATGGGDFERLDGVQAVVHLAGENVATGRWNAEKKRRIRDSRVLGTRALCLALANLARPPRVVVAASAIGFYGNRGDTELTEDSHPGNDFLANVCVEWEQATRPAVDVGIRVVNLRIGVVLSPAGGALPKMLRPFRLGLGGPIGAGTQYLSWISLTDLVRSIEFVLRNESLRGPVNAVAPNPVTNAEFTRALGAALNRPAALRPPAWAVRLAVGEMADALLLSSTRVLPARLLRTGFEFRHPALPAALRELLNTARG